MKMKRLERIAAALALCFAAPLFAVDSNALVEAAKKGDAAAIKPLLAEERHIFFNGRRRIHGLQIFSARQARIQPFWSHFLA